MADKRLIDAKKLYEDFVFWEYANTDPWKLFDIKITIDEQPTVDAVEVVHGHWNVLHFITEPWQLSLPDKYVCSECKKITWSKHNYCPNCGAKMDGDGNG